MVWLSVSGSKWSVYNYVVLKTVTTALTMLLEAYGESHTQPASTAATSNLTACMPGWLVLTHECSSPHRIRLTCDTNGAACCPCWCGAGLYGEGQFRWRNGYIYLTCINNVSQM